MEGALMEFDFTVFIDKLGTRNVVEGNSMALLDAFAETHPEAGAAVGADLVAGALEAAFCASGSSLDEAEQAARQILADVIAASGLRPPGEIRLQVETELTEQALAS
jgi:hypothetical protein